MGEGFSKKHLEDLKAERDRTRRGESEDAEEYGAAYLQHLEDKKKRQVAELEAAKENFRNHVKEKQKEWERKKYLSLR